MEIIWHKLLVSIVFFIKRFLLIFLIKFSEHINYVRDTIGSSFVGIGGDYDGVNT